ncbi:MAG: DUF1707 domain-containing protein [Thermoleophilaceae bacterium]
MSAPALRASDADREVAAERLRAAAVEGRLTPDELEQRLEAALGGGTYGELEALVADLPPPPPSDRPRRARTRRPPELTAYLATSVLLVTIWALTGAGYFWPVWPILGWGVFVTGPGCRAIPLRASRGRPG